MHDYRTVSVAVGSLRDKMVVGMMGMSTHFSVVLSGVQSRGVASVIMGVVYYVEG